MKWKWISGFFVLLIVIAIAAIYVVLAHYDYNKLKPKASQVVKNATGRELIFGGDVHLKIGFSPKLVLEDVRFANASWGSRPELIKIGRLEVQVALFPLFRGNIQVKNLAIFEPDIVIETNRSGASNLKFEPIGKGAPRASMEKKKKTTMPLSELRQLRMVKGRITYKDLKSGDIHRVSWDSFKLVAKPLGDLLTLDLAGSYKNIPYEIHGDIGSLVAFFDPQKDWEVNFTAKGADTTLTVEGTIRDVMDARGLNLVVSVKGSQVSETARLAGWEDVPYMGPFKIGFKLSDFGQRTYELSHLESTVDKNTLNGSAKIGLAEKKPSIKATLSSDHLDLRPLFVRKESTDRSTPSDVQAAQGGQKVFSHEPLPIGSLSAADVDIQLEAKKLLLPMLAMEEASLGMTTQQGNLALNLIKATVGGGRAKGGLAVNNQKHGAEVTAEVVMHEVEMGALLADLGVRDVAEGKIDLELDLSGSGKSLRAIMAGMNGNISFVMGKGELNNEYVESFRNDLISSMGRIFNPFAEKEKYTVGNCFICQLDIENGVAGIDNLVLDTKKVTVIGEGKINLNTEQLDVSMKSFPKKGVTGFRVSIGDWSKPFKLGGTLVNPTVAVDSSKTAMMVGKAVGGTMLFGPLGVAVALVGVSTGHENPCVAAVRAAKKGVKVLPGNEKIKAKQ
jgi:uncharacterized protein involved in outer membrane biogenesis